MARKGSYQRKNRDGFAHELGDAVKNSFTAMGSALLDGLHFVGKVGFFAGKTLACIVVFPYGAYVLNEHRKERKNSKSESNASLVTSEKERDNEARLRAEKRMQPKKDEIAKHRAELKKKTEAEIDTISAKKVPACANSGTRKEPHLSKASKKSSGATNNQSWGEYISACLPSFFFTKPEADICGATPQARRAGMDNAGKNVKNVVYTVGEVVGGTVHHGSEYGGSRLTNST